jgi:hypothetical protein
MFNQQQQQRRQQQQMLDLQKAELQSRGVELPEQEEGVLNGLMNKARGAYGDALRGMGANTGSQQGGIEMPEDNSFIGQTKNALRNSDFLKSVLGKLLFL